MRTPKLFASIGTAAAALPLLLSTAALANLPQETLAQSSPIDGQYLDSLYSFLESSDDLAHEMAITEFSPADHISTAQAFCQVFEMGTTPTEAITAYFYGVIEEAEKQGLSDSEEVGYAAGLYGGAVMNIGSAYYCPEFQNQVKQALRDF